MAERSLLIIDKDEVLVSEFKDGLEPLGYQVATAFEGLQGMMQALQNRPDLIVLESNMPTGSGSGIYDRLRSSIGTDKTPIVFLSGISVDDVRKTIRSTPNTFFLKKPISIPHLHKVLNRILAATGG